MSISPSSPMRSLLSPSNSLPMARRIVRYTVAAAALLTLCLAVSPASTPPASPAQQVSSMAPEVRLRKLHLVRPDLIPYPISYDVVC